MRTTLRLKILGSGDEEALERFLAEHAESSMFLRANARAAGLADRGQPLQATYVAAVEGDRVVAVAAHAWNGMLLIQAPVALDEVARAAVVLSGRPVHGLSGPWAQVVEARDALGLADTPAQMDNRNELFVLALRAMVIPPALAEGRVRCRRPRDEELPLLTVWRAAYRMEELRQPEEPALHAQSRDDMELLQAQSAHWLLEAEGEPVAYAALNARLPDIVQVGGVWTPPAQRGRGYARCVVAGSLLEARDEGVSRAVLFTDHDNVPARKAYLALGFEIVDDYGLTIFG